MTIDSLPQFSIRELNAAIGNLLARGFAPRFLLEATVSKPQIKKGHLWLTLTDGDASITSVIWASQLKQIQYRPKDGDGVTVIGKLNFWTTRAALNVQVLDMRPSLSTVLRQYEIVKELLLQEGLINEERRRILPKYPSKIALMTSVPSSALADMIKTAADRWPITHLCVIPIPVQGEVSDQIQKKLCLLADQYKKLGIEVLIIARGGGSREDLMVFDEEHLCRTIANFPIPIITGIGHEDDLTVADLVADLRSATPTSAIVSLLPSREAEESNLLQIKRRLSENCNWIIKKERQVLKEIISNFSATSPTHIVRQKRTKLSEKEKLLNSHSPEKWLKRGFSIVKNDLGKSILSVKDVSIPEMLTIKFSDGLIIAKAESIVQEKSSS